MGMRKRMRGCLLAVLMMVCLGGAILSAAADSPAPVQEGLFLWYDGIQNTSDGHDAASAVWYDRSGNQNDMSFYLEYENGRIGWSEDALCLAESGVMLPVKGRSAVNGGTYTIELVTGELLQNGAAHMKFIHSDMAEMVLFIRMDSGERLELLRSGTSGGNQSVYGGDGFESYCHTTLTVTVDMAAASEGANVKLYVGGELVAEGTMTDAKAVSSLYLGSNTRYAKWGGELHGLRIYDRALNAEEVRANAEADRQIYSLDVVENIENVEPVETEEEILTEITTEPSDMVGTDTVGTDTVITDVTETEAVTDGADADTSETVETVPSDASCTAAVGFAPLGLALAVGAVALKKKEGRNG